MEERRKKLVAKNSKKEPKSRRFENLKRNSELLKVAKRRAHTVVLNLLNANINREYLAENIIHLTREAFEDVSVERSIAGLCGYPLCDKKVSGEKFKNQTYAIRRNKVFDVTQRKNFCSNKCFEAFELLQLQIPTIPLYLREKDQEVQNLKIIIPVLEKLKGRFGKRVNITGTLCNSDLRGDDYEEDFEMKSEDIDHAHPLDGESYLPEDESHLPDEESHLPDEKSHLLDEESHLPPKPGELNEEEVIGRSTETPCSNTNANMIASPLDKGSKSIDMENKLSEEIRNLSLKKEGKIVNENRNKSEISSETDDVFEIERALREWMTFESLRMILGDTYVKGMLEHWGEVWECYDRSSDMKFPRLDMKAKYIALCKKLNKLEMKERVSDAQLETEMEEDEGQERLPGREATKPMPNLDQLKKDVEQSSLKVRAFYEGVEEYASKKEVLEVIKEEEEEGEVTKRSSSKRSEKRGEDVLVSLPLIDVYSQKSWRREIVFEKLRKRLSDLAISLGLDEREIRLLVAPLIETFEFASHNISFKVNQWNFVALIILKMLSVRYPVIRKAFLPQEKTFGVVSGHLRSMGLDEGYLDRLLSYLTDISYILEKTDKIVSLNDDD